MKMIITPCRYRKIIKTHWRSGSAYTAEEMEAVRELLPRRIYRGAYMSQDELKAFHSEYDEIERSVYHYWGGGDGVEFEEIYEIKDKYFSLVYSENGDDCNSWDFSIKEVVPKQITKTIYVTKE